MKLLITTRADNRIPDWVALTHPLLKECTAKVGADFQVIDYVTDCDVGAGRWHYRIMKHYELHEEYDRILHIDTDTLIMPSCPNLYVVKMEDLILDLDGTIAGICEFCEIPVSPQMRDFIPRYRTPDKAARYKTLDNGEVDIHKRVNEIYGGYFAGNGWRDPSWGDVTIESLWAALRPCVEYFGYDCDNQ